MRSAASAIVDRTDYLKRVIDALTEAGFAPGMITGGGTGTHRIDADLGVLNELQVGLVRVHGPAVQ